jgi:DNA adenine methylase
MSIVPWIGGKGRLAKHILPLFPPHTCYVEPFCGAAALLFIKEPSKVEVLNDVNHELVTLYRVLQHHLEEFVRQFKWALTSRQIFDWCKETPPETLTDIQRAARFYYLQKMAFGGVVGKQTFGTRTTAKPSLNLLRIEEDLSQAHLRLTKVYIENLDWRDCIDRYDRPHTLFYLDPPYWGTKGYGVPFPIEEYSLIAEKLKSIKGKALISVNDIPEMSKAFKGFSRKVVKVGYSMGNRHGKGARRKELILRTW